VRAVPKLLTLLVLILALNVRAGQAETMSAPEHPFEADPAILHYLTCSADGSAQYVPYPEATAAYRWIDIIQEVTARDVDKVGARPTIIARQMAIATSAMYNAWAAYDDKAVGTRLGGSLRRPAAERTQANKEAAIAYAVTDALRFAFPQDVEYIDSQLAAMGYDPVNESRDPATPAGIGHLVADALLEYHRNDGSNQFGDMPGCDGKPYSDHTGYVCKNTAEELKDPDCWQPITFTRPNGEQFTPGYLTPHWGGVKTLTLESGDQFRPPPPPKVGTPQMQREVDEIIRLHAGLTPEQKAVVEFMRDGPRSTGQSGHWLRFAQDVSRRDRLSLDDDVKLFFAVGGICHDAFIACWEAKRFYDSSRPWSLVHHYYGDKMIPGWTGPNSGVQLIKGSQWRPYSPDFFITPPFPGYPSGHSTVSSAAATILKDFTGSDYFGFVAKRVPGSLTGEAQADKCVYLELPSFTATAAMAGISRVMGGYHIQSDNIAALELGRKVADYSWPKYQAYFDGTAAR
jgi:hypothetical protein